MMRAPFFGLNARMLSARSTGRPADLVGDEPALLGRQAYAAQRGSGFHHVPHLRFGGAVGAATFLSDECPLNVRVSANSPSLWPTMFSDT